MESPHSRSVDGLTSPGHGVTDQDPTARAVASFQAGHDRDASFRVLFDHYRRPVERFFARKGVPREECLDLTQETFLGIYRGLEGFRGESRLPSWIFRIALMAYLKRLRAARTAKRTGRDVAEEDLGASEPALATPGRQLDEVLASQRRAALVAAVRGLPPQMRQCLMLRLYQEMKYREIATVMKLSIETVKAHLFQARTRLRKKLGERFDAGLSFEAETGTET